MTLICYDNTEELIAMFYDIVALNEMHRCFKKLREHQLLRKLVLHWRDTVVFSYSISYS